MEFIKIVLMCVVAAVVYGICQDMVTAHVCVEYFSVGHPPIFGGTESPILLALGWGLFATWWVGAMLGVPAALLARTGSRPKLTWRDLQQPIAILFAIVAAAAIVAWPLGWLSAQSVPGTGAFRVRGVSDDRVTVYMGNAAAHSAAYGVGFVGGIMAWGWIWWRRGRRERQLLLIELDRLRAENRKLVEWLAQREPESRS